MLIIILKYFQANRSNIIITKIKNEINDKELKEEVKDF